MELQAFSSGGGFYHAMCEWGGVYYVVQNEGFNCLSWYVDSEMEEMIDSVNVTDLKGDLVRIYSILHNYLRLEYPRINYYEF